MTIVLSVKADVLSPLNAILKKDDVTEMLLRHHQRDPSIVFSFYGDTKNSTITLSALTSNVNHIKKDLKNALAEVLGEFGLFHSLTLKNKKWSTEIK